MAGKSALGPFFGVTLPPQLKSVSQLLRKAQELEHHDAVMCYFCLFQAVKQIMPLRAECPEAGQLLGSFLSKLEQLKGQVQAQLPSQDDQQQYVTRFAMGVFDRANQEDLRGQATQRTAHNFYAASTFFSVLKVFAPDGETLPDDVQEKSRYAKWKAADITSALREGRQPVPGGPEQQQQPAADDHLPASHPSLEQPPQSDSRSIFDLFPAPPSSFPAGAAPPPPPPADHASLFPSQPPAASLFPSPPPATQQPPPSSLFPSPPQSFGAPPPSSQSFGAPPPSSQSFGAPAQSPFGPPPPSQPPFGGAQPQQTTFPPVQQAAATQRQLPPAEKIEQAQKFAKFAVSSLEFDDVETAKTNLEKALSLLKSL